MQDMIGIVGWVIALISLGTLILLVIQKKISKTDLVALLDAFLASEAVKNLEDKAWKEIFNAAKDKLKGTAVWPIFKKWYNEDDNSETATSDDKEEIVDKEKDPIKKEEVKVEEKKKDEEPEKPAVEEEKKEEPVEKTVDKEDPDKVRKKKVQDMIDKKRAELKAKTENKE